ncbi:RND transporter [Acinetobacter sp. NRRL B-65365]|uniref:putative solute-binding protein n=1 Tax=Acinetobacter sp. NRRL B-65365 TaxID=1785092 RepID=UPI0007A01360|nr:putative solute-binding protein [Acinetobacter sp. NRRL B-65365]KYQ83920.1 RND transporter [Acinetobacter sp. NRRL B-65365]
MKKGILALGAMLILAVNTQASAATKICVFDLMGKSGEAYKAMEEWALVASAWQGEINLVSYQNEAMAEHDFEQGRCEGVYMTSMRARAYNKFAGSVDAIGAVPSYAIAQKAISFALDKRNQRRLISRVANQSYEVAGISQIGLAYIFVKDKRMNTIEQIRGKKFAVLGYDEAQKIVVRSLGGQAVLSDILDIAKKFNQGQADIMAAPAYAYKPLEIYKGLGTDGAIITFPAVNMTMDLIIRPKKFTTNFGQNSRQWFLNRLNTNFALIQRIEAELPAKYKINLSQEDKTRYQQILREARIDLTKRGIYDATMMNVLKRARCTVDRTNFECTLGGE